MTTSASSPAINNSNSTNHHTNNRQYGSIYSSTARKSSSCGSSIKDDKNRIGPSANISINLATVQEVAVVSPTEEEPKKMAAIPSVAAAVAAVAPDGDDDNGRDGVVHTHDNEVSFLVDSGDMMQHWKSFNTSTLGRLESWAELKQVCLYLVSAILFSWKTVEGEKVFWF
jgi:hypothetical protein